MAIVLNMFIFNKKLNYKVRMLFYTFLKLTTLFKSDLPIYKRRDILLNRLFFARLVPIVTKIILAYYETF